MSGSSRLAGLTGAPAFTIGDTVFSFVKEWAGVLPVVATGEAVVPLQRSGASIALEDVSLKIASRQGPVGDPSERHASGRCGGIRLPRGALGEWQVDDLEPGCGAGHADHRAGP